MKSKDRNGNLKLNQMKVEVIKTDGLSESVKSKIKSTMTFTKWWEENDTMFCQLENESGDIIRIFPERVKPFHSFAKLEDVKEVSRDIVLIN